MVTKDELFAEILRQNIEIRELKEHLATTLVDMANADWRLSELKEAVGWYSSFDPSSTEIILDRYGMALDSQKD